MKLNELPNHTLFFDTETLNLNPYHLDNKMVLAQIGCLEDGELKIYIFKEWELGELNVINSIIMMFESVPKYTPVFTYNGLFDILYLIGRCNMLNKSFKEMGDISSLFTSNLKHCDLMQYDNGYLCSLDRVCAKYNVSSKCIYKGKDIYKLYMNKEWDKIISHGEDDIERMYKLVTQTSIADRFYKISLLEGKS